MPDLGRDSAYCGIATSPRENGKIKALAMKPGQLHLKIFF